MRPFIECYMDSSHFFMQKRNTHIFIFAGVIAIVVSVLFVWFQVNSVEKKVAAESSIGILESKFRDERENIDTGILLTNAYLQEIRETADTALYTKIEDVLETLEGTHGDTAEIFAKRAEVANGRHDFKKGLEYIHKAIQLNSKHAAYFGIKSDSEIELGMYDESLRSLQTMVDLKPDFSSFSRIAYHRELYGDTEGALEALEAAISAGSVHSENIAWAHVESGKLRLLSDLRGAAQDFERAFTFFPEYAPAFEGLGRVAYAEGKKDEALDYYQRAFVSLPIAAYAITLGTFYEAEGDITNATQQYALADLAYRNAKETNVDLEYSLFLADHGDSGEALRLAEKVYNDRKTIFTADAYAWALFKNNQIEKAKALSAEALRLGGYDKTLFLHAEMINEGVSKTSEAQELFPKDTL